MEVIASTRDGIWSIREEVRDSDSFVETHRSVSFIVVHEPSGDEVFRAGYSETSNADGSSVYGTTRVCFTQDERSIEVTDDGGVRVMALEWPVEPLPPPEGMKVPEFMRRQYEADLAEYEKKLRRRAKIEGAWRKKK